MTERAMTPEEIRRADLEYYRSLLPWPLKFLIPEPEPEPEAEI